jgi:hypothetical protein
MSAPLHGEPVFECFEVSGALEELRELQQPHDLEDFRNLGRFERARLAAAELPTQATMGQAGDCLELLPRCILSTRTRRSLCAD